MKDMEKTPLTVILYILAIAFGVFISCCVGTYVWNHVIVDQLHLVDMLITKKQFLYIEILICAVTSLNDNCNMFCDWIKSDKE